MALSGQAVSESPAGLTKAQVVWLQSAVSDPGALGWGPGICLSGKCPGDTDVAGPGSAFRGPRS